MRLSWSLANKSYLKAAISISAVVKKGNVPEDYEEIFSLTDSDREDLRNKTVLKFLTEKKGYIKDSLKYVTRYKYYVETLKDGRRIYLLRPTFLNKGIDFQVWLEKYDNEKDKKPSHKGVIEDLLLKHKEKPAEYNNLIKAIDRVWNCEEPDKVLKDYSFSFSKGLSVEALLKILKWLFIEQDITYWNYDGREMLKRAIMEAVSSS